MANLIIQENGVPRTTHAVHGEEITIQTPCDCSAVTGVQIAGVAYPFYDAAGKPLPVGTGLFAENSLIRVLIDTVNNRSTIINHAITPASIGAPTVAEMNAAIGAIPTPDVSGQINTHNTDSNAHSDIRTALNGKASATHNHSASEITSGTLGVARGGTGATTFTSGQALIGAGTGAVTTRAITNNTNATSAISANTNLVTMNTLRYAMNRTTGIGSADTNYSTSMVRGISAGTADLTAGSSSLTSGAIYFVYE